MTSSFRFKIDMPNIRIDRIEIGGSQPPHELKIVIGGEVGQQVGDDIVIVMHDRRREFLKAVGPTIEEAFERIFLEPKATTEISDFDL